MTAQTYLDQRNNQQRTSSLRRKDKLWIYKNPQGLMILEDELNERRKKRFARQRMSPPIKDSQVVDLPIENELISIAPLNKIASSIPENAIFPIARKSTIQEPVNNDNEKTEKNKNDVTELTGQTKPSTNKFDKQNIEHQSVETSLEKKDMRTAKDKIGKLSLDRFLPKEQQANSERPNNEGQPAKRNLISERSKLFLQPKAETAILPKSSISTSPKKETIPKAFIVPESNKSEITCIKPVLTTSPKKEIVPKAFMSSELIQKPLEFPRKEITPNMLLRKTEAAAETNKLSNKKDIIPKAFLVESTKSDVLPKSEAQKTKAVNSPSVDIKPNVSISSPFLRKDNSHFSKPLSSSPTTVVEAPSYPFQKQQKKAIPSRQSTASLSSSTPPSSFLAEAKKKLTSAQKSIVVPEAKTKAVTPETSSRKQGLVSSFVTALESPPLQQQKIEDEKTYKEKITVLSNNSPLPTKGPPELPKHSRFSPVSDPVTIPKEQTPPPLLRSSTKTHIFTLNQLENSNSQEKPLIERKSVSPLISPTRNQFDRNMTSRSSSPSIDSTINVYLPRLSPDISFSDQDHQLAVPEKEQTEEEAEEHGRPVIKKRVSFSDQLLTYIPEHSPSDDDDATTVASSNSEQTRNVKISVFKFFDTLNQELSETKKKPVEERKVNTTPSREPFIPAVIKKVNSGSVSSSSSSPPQKLSNKLLDMFQQKLSQSPKQQPPKQQEQQQQVPQPLVHLTKTRPRKPASLKKPTYPAATAQPNWRNRATNKKYEFVA